MVDINMPDLSEAPIEEQLTIMADNSAELIAELILLTQRFVELDQSGVDKGLAWEMLSDYIVPFVGRNLVRMQVLGGKLVPYIEKVERDLEELTVAFYASKDDV